ncbi:hypothetical protein [Massilia genomosp. 1]|uniref:Lipoprotein n=1 Tax=Massilia genomosp. 1 TaxID=2609280 RepID=A0ABX0N207_9BURK|nr:hypothetical protein [Massilia genomosp. 1]NHZ66471.1 hypothetical protein [Massilia genomosp. 1]
MKKNLPGIIALIYGAALGLACPAALAACEAHPGYLSEFEGSIGGKYRIGMSLIFDNPGVAGDYFYVSQRKDIIVRGTVQADGRIKLAEWDEHGKESADFDLSPSKECNALDGVWRKRGSATSLPVHLSSTGGGKGGTHDRYWRAGAETAEDVMRINRAAYTFWLGVKEGNKKVVAAQLRYPVNVSVGGRRTTLKTGAALIANYDAIFTDKYRAAILNGVPHNMSSNTQGIMLGNGEVWFNEQGKVISLNN